MHITCAVPYAVLGAFQFSSRLRRRHPRWHRATGKVVVALGLAVALSGLWMTVFYARQPGTGELAFLFRLTFGSALAACIVLGFSAIRRGDVPTHQAWMTRAYAIALAAGTQTLTLAVGPARLRPRRARQGPEPGRRLAGQPGRRRGRHPPCGRPSAPVAVLPVGAP